MAGPKDVTVRVQALDGSWETVGVDRLTGVVPENVSITNDDAGPASVSFDLHRAGRSPWPDISAFTPVDLEAGGVRVWAGRVKETPLRDGADRVMNVQCEGLQYHLDDDSLVPWYVHTRLGDYRDARSFAGANLTQARQSGNVSNDNGVITLGWPATETLKHNDMVGVVLDLGPDTNGWLRLVVEWESSNNISSALEFVARGSDDDYAQSGGPVEDAFVIGGLSGASGTTSGSIANGRRYVHLFLYWLAADMGAPLGADAWWKIKAVRAFGQTAYESGGQSVLAASTIVADAITRGTKLLSSDMSQIQATSFAIPDFATDAMQTPREIIAAANAYHDYIAGVDHLKRAVFKPKPASAQIEVGEWSAMEFEDASANSGQDIYNQVIVEADSPSGRKMNIARQASALASATQLAAISSPVPTNPSFDVDTTGWTPAGSMTFARTTTAGQFDTSPAAGRMTMSAGQAGSVTTTFSGTFLAGITYTLRLWVKADIFDNRTRSLIAEFGLLGSDQSTISLGAGATGNPQYVTWTPRANRTGVTLRLSITAGALSVAVNIDSLALLTASTTLVDRRVFKRTKLLQVSSSLPDDGVAAGRLGDTWLYGHLTTPFRGTVKITGDTSVRNILTGAYVPCERLLLMTGELLRFSDRSDPDTGGHGRDGRIAQVTYTPADDSAVVTIDNQRSSFEALLARLAVVTGGG